jgi:hypothetical protein
METNIFQKIGTLIPGYKGYQEREGRRECDRLLREEISDGLMRIEKKINGLFDEADLDAISNIELVRKKINNLKDLMKYASYGESPFFSDSVIKEDELDVIYQMDLDVMDIVKSITINDNNLKNIKTQILSLEDVINKRNQYLKFK